MESCEALYVYESVQLELTFLNQQSEDEMSKFSNLQLVKGEWFLIFFCFPRNLRCKSFTRFYGINTYTMQ